MAEQRDAGARTRIEQLDRRLQRGPLPVASLFSPERAAGVAQRGLRVRRKRALLGGLALAACLLAASVYGLRSQPVPHADHASDRPASLRLSDGSLVELHGASSTVLTEQIAKERVSLRLSGGARFDVVPNPARTFEVLSREITVRVLGTAFSVDPEGARTRVAVERGRVQVIWRDGAALLSAGEAGLFPPGAEAAASAPAEEPAREVTVVPAKTNASSASSASARATPTHESPKAARRSATELMLAADVARLSARPEEAVTALDELVRRFPRDRRAPVAAFTLGRVLLDELGRSSEAATAFERACTLWPSGPLAESSLARAVEAQRRAGNAPRARALAEQYLRRFAQGQHAAAMRSLIAP